MPRVAAQADAMVGADSKPLFLQRAACKKRIPMCKYPVLPPARLSGAILVPVLCWCSHSSAWEPVWAGGDNSAALLTGSPSLWITTPIAPGSSIHPVLILHTSKVGSFTQPGCAMAQGAREIVLAGLCIPVYGLRQVWVQETHSLKGCSRAVGFEGCPSPHQSICCL